MKRPTVVTVFGILNIVFGVFGICGLIVTGLFADRLPGADQNPALKMMQDNPGFAAWTKVSVTLGLLGCALLLLAGVGLLMFKSWGRILSIVYAIYAIINDLLGMVMTYIFLVGPMLKEAGNKQGPEAAATMGAAIGGVVGGCIGLVYPVLLLIFMTRPKVVAAFNPSRAYDEYDSESRYDR